MNWRTTGVLFLVLAAIIGYLVWDSRQAETAVEPLATTAPLPPTPQRVTLLAADAAAISRVTVIDMSDASRVALSQTEPSVWEQVEPTPSEVISATVNTAVFGLANLTSTRSLSADANPLSAYGLDQPTYTIETLYRNESDQTLRVTLLIGAPVPTGSGYYVLKEGDPRVHIVPTGLIDNLVNLLTNPPLQAPTDEPTSDS